MRLGANDLVFAELIKPMEIPGISMNIRYWSNTRHPCETDVCSYLSKTNCCNYVPWASYQIRKIAGCACAGNAGNVFPRRRFLREPLVSDPGMHHGTCVTHVPWCMPGSLTCGDGENVPGIPGACASAIVRIWQEAHRKWCITYPCHSHCFGLYFCKKYKLRLPRDREWLFSHMNQINV